MTAARVEYLATTGTDLLPHIVPVTHAVDGDEIVVGIDQKPKSTQDVRRLRNIAANPRVAVLCDSYDDDWTRLWWVRADGVAIVVDAGAAWAAAVDRLAAKYTQYENDPPRGPVICIGVSDWSGWSYSS